MTRLLFTMFFIGSVSYTSPAHAVNLIAEASKFLGMTASQLGLPPRLWCADFMNKLVGGSSRAAISYARRGSPTKPGCTNCVVVTKRKGGHHVGIVKSYDKMGNPIIISGNYGRKVAIGKVSKHKVIAYRKI